MSVTVAIEEIVIGDFLLKRTRKGALYIERQGGENMECNEVTEAALESALEQFWDANF